MEEISGILTETAILGRMYNPDLKKRIVITPLLSPKEQLQPTSVDLRLGTEFMILRTTKFEFVNILADPEIAEKELSEYTEIVRISGRDRFVIHPGEFVLGSSLEFVCLPSDIAGRLEGKSTWGRMGLQIHSTAGFVDPGFSGSLTYELQNVGKIPIPLYPGMNVAQICFFQCSMETCIPYNRKQTSLYGGWPGLQMSKYYRREDIAVLRKMYNQNNLQEGTLR